ncbi:hypothetical protein V6N11_068585 [Hibiscus sabdariffa]|uniref:GAG-pre-integrase domain-containing protein n=1 Tax=Hibiscus sabdariffa TaxID=183260 RepID=A0ABR2PAX4_9ROSI
MGLNDSYSAVRSQILLMQPLPQVNQAYSMVVQEEAQRSHLSMLATPESSVFFSNSFGASGSDRRRFSGSCDYCKVRGHKKDQCYRLIGFPPGYKFNRRKVAEAAVAIDSSVMPEPTAPEFARSTASVASAASPPIFTQEQYTQILSLLNKAPSAESAVNLAGIIPVNSFKSNVLPTWIVDTGATDHILSNFKSLDSPVSCSSRFVRLPDGKTAPVTHLGSHKLTPDLVLHNILFVPDFHHNLLSVSKLTRDLNCFLTFYPDFCVLQELSTGRMMGIGREFKGLYLFVAVKPESSLSGLLSSHSSHACHSIVLDSTCTWHARLGHASFSKLNKIEFLKSASLDSDLVHKCAICPLAKQTRLPFSTSTTRTESPFQLIHIDLWGPYRTSTHSGCRFFLTIVDDYSRMSWIYLLKHKSEALSSLKQFLLLVQNQFSATVKVLYIKALACTLHSKMELLKENIDMS